MKINLKLTGLIGVTLFLSTAALAQTTLTGEIRPRFEYRHGYGKPADSLQLSSKFIQQRTRLNFGYKADKFKVGITLQDVRVWGNQPQLNSYDVNAYGIHEGWAEYSFNKKISMKMGRQEISYDDQRIMGTSDWTQYGRSHDAFILKYTDSTFTAHAGIAYNQNDVSSVATNYTYTTPSYKEMQYLWLNKQINALNVSLLVLNAGQQSPISVNSTRYITTLGTHIEYKKNALFADANFYYQSGNDVTLNSKKEPKKVAAMLGSFNVAYTLKEKFVIGLGYEYISGQSQTDTATVYKDVNHAFNPIFGANHKYNGYMDYFYVGNHTNTVGLQDIVFRLKYKAEKWNVALDVHQFMAATDVLDSKVLATTGKITAMKSTFGTELDLTCGYTLPGGVNVAVGYSQFLVSETLGKLKGIADYTKDGKSNEMSNWAYVMITFKPNFLK